MPGSSWGPPSRSKSGCVSLKSRMVALSFGGFGGGASQFCHLPSKHVSVPVPQIVEHERVASGTSHTLQEPPAQDCEPAPQSFAQARVAGGTSQCPHVPSRQTSTPCPHSSAQGLPTMGTSQAR